MESVIDFSCLFSLSLYTFFSGTRAMCKDKFNIFPCATYCVTRGLFASFFPVEQEERRRRWGRSEC